MRIAMVTATPQSVAEGSGTYLAAATLAAGLEASGHRVRLVTPRRPTGPLGYTVHRFRFNRALDATVAHDADAVIGWDMDGYRVAGTLPVPYVAYVHGILAEEARHERGAVRVSMQWQARAERRNVRRADGVLTVSAWARQRLCAVYGIPAERVAVVPPAFDRSRWRALLARDGPPQRAADPTVLCVARLYPRKDHATLLRASALLRHTVPELRVIIVGDGPERRRLTRLAVRLGLAGTVRFAGQLSLAHLVRLYRDCDVFCLPSRQEGFGLVFAEALASGKPVVACRDTAAVEIVRDGTTGTLVPGGDAEALAAALARWLARARAEPGPLVEASRLLDRLAPTAVAHGLIAALEAVPRPGRTRGPHRGVETR